MKDDLVVVVPGIMGTALTWEGVDVWNLGPRAAAGLLRPGRTLERLRLQQGIGDEDPEPPHALSLGGPIRTQRVLPGLVAHLGYGGLAGRLGIAPERLAVFPYDWRLSNVNSAMKLERFVGERLERWRTTADPERFPGARDAKVVFVCRSMGGLVVRHFAEVLGGHRVTRAVASLGTPYMGSVKALRFLLGEGLGPLPAAWREAIAEACSTYPSLHQLLPVYRAVVTEDGYPARLGEVPPVPGLPTAMIVDAFRFHRRMQKAARANRANEAGGTAGYDLVPLGGATHRTAHGVSFDPAGRPRFHDGLPGDGGPWLGDGTVPQLSATPPEHRTTATTMWFPHRHASLLDAAPVQYQLRHICNGVERPRFLASDHDIGIELPDVALAGAPIEVWATRVDRAMDLRVRRLAQDGRCLAAEPMRPAGDGRFRAELRAEPGTWTLEVSSPTTGYACRDAVLVMEA
ncbi:esterase/lipase family protein [Streptomyces racemochromogenes]|uniref:esterase/lipase family protein n=1 Tax=Streptomyces racemochromogenes TaxID=67353 RepID=UPI0031EF68EB